MEALLVSARPARRNDAPHPPARRGLDRRPAPALAARQPRPGHGGRAAAADKNPTAVGTGGAVTSVDPDATRVGLRVLRQGGNAVDAAVATAAALGVTEPYSAGIGGGGYLVDLDGRTGEVLHHRRPRDRPAGDARRRVHRPRRRASRTPSPPTWSPAASRSACPAPRPPGRRALDAWGTRCAAPGAAAGGQAGPPGLRGRPHLPDQTDDNPERFAAFSSTAAVPARRRGPRGRAASSPTPTSRDTYDLLAPQGHRTVLPRQAGDEDRRTHPQAPGGRATPTCRCPPGT